MGNSVTDAVLLERFVQRREQAAFEALVQRHVGLVRKVSRRFLRNEHDAEDVAQATFLVLALRAPEIPWQGSVGGWLAGVARRLALNSRAVASRRRSVETPVASLIGRRDSGPAGFPEEHHPTFEPTLELERRDLRQVIDRELSRLPEKDRDAVLLCDLEGLTHTEAARRLGIPAGSISRRLSRARGVLRHRLALRGLPVAVMVASCLILARWSLDRTSDEVAPEHRPIVAGTLPRHGDLVPGGRLLALALIEPGPARTAELLGLAEDALKSASVLESQGPPTPARSAGWRAGVSGLRLAALDLAGSAVEGNDSGMTAAARRLDGRCVQCHVAFRE
ncbi:MAG: sigma-70 family RNA polymerase sigma factor [Isosphaeraceae bacterium]